MGNAFADLKVENAAVATVQITCFGKTTTLRASIDPWKENREHIDFLVKSDDQAAKHEHSY